jgi:hypothetical protein
VRGPSRLALGILAAGLALTATAEALMPVGFPLFDGVVVSDPYRFLSPPPGGDGSPTSAADTIPVTGSSSPAFAAYTSETPPQAELLAHGGELAIRATTTAVKVTIDPVAPPANATGGTVAGNVYRIRLTDQSGAALALVPGQTITLAMRGPTGIAADAVIARLVDGAWQGLQTSPSGLQDLFLANATAFGDFAMLGAIPPPPSGFDPQLLILALIGAGFVALVGLRYRGVPPREKRGSSQEVSGTTRRRRR